MRKLLAAVLFLIPSVAVPQAVKPLNAVGVAKGCDNVTVQCTYTDAAILPGKHFYFVVAQDSVTGKYSGPSSRVDVVVPAGNHTVALTWNPQPQPSPNVYYYIYRGAPATNLTGTPQ